MCLFYYPVKPIDIFYTLFITQIVGNSLVVQWLGLHIFTAWIQCLVRELISHKLQKKKKKLLKGTNLILKGKVMMEEELEKKTKRSPNKKGMKCSF